jgi:predicted RNA-binding Zn-ribbon protein involved in translation (DUF1610 family)
MRNLLEAKHIPMNHSCPNCGKEHDAVTHTASDKAIPKAGDVNICFDCGMRYVSA